MEFLYVDDSVLLAAHKDKTVVKKTLSVELASVSTWLSGNRLSLHFWFYTFLIQNKMIQVTSFFNITLGEFQITAKNSISDEMRCFDRFLSGEDIALKALTKITQRTKFLARQTSFLDSSTFILSKLLFKVIVTILLFPGTLNYPSILKTDCKWLKIN